jgi:hypothetical protein
LFRRNFLCLMIAVIFPASLIADDAGAAILRSNGDALLNGNPAPATAAIFPGDTVRIPPKSAARIEVSGSTVDISAETILQFESDEVRLDHGTVSVNTSRGFRVRVGCLTVTPVNKEDWSHYDVTDTNGKVNVSALKSDENIDSRGGEARAVKTGNSGRVTVREGEQKSREEKCGGADIKDGIAANGPILNSPYVMPAAWIIGAGTICLLFCFNSNPLSPSSPSNAH